MGVEPTHPVLRIRRSERRLSTNFNTMASVNADGLSTNLPAGRQVSTPWQVPIFYHYRDPAHINRKFDKISPYRGIS